MKYNAEGWVEKEIENKAGDIVEGTVSEIEDGTLGKFVKDFSKFDKSGKSNKEQPAILVKTSAKSASLMIALPEGKDYHPKSKMAQYIRTYKKAPFIGQKIKAMSDENGFYNLILAK